MRKIYHSRPCEPWIIREFETDIMFFDYLKTLQPVHNRPTHIIVTNVTEAEVQKTLEMLYVPQVFWLKDGKLIGGFGYTRKYFCRPDVAPKIVGHEMIDGGKFPFNGDS